MDGRIDAPAGDTSAGNTLIVVTGSVYYTPGGVSEQNSIRVILSNPVTGSMVQSPSLITNPSVFGLTAPGPGPYYLGFHYKDSVAQTYSGVGGPVELYGYSGCNPLDSGVAMITASMDIGTFTFDASVRTMGVAGTLNYNGSLVSPTNQVIRAVLYDDSGYSQPLYANEEASPGNNHQPYGIHDPKGSLCASRIVYVRAWAHTSGDGCDNSLCAGQPYFQGPFTTSSAHNQDINFGDSLVW